MACLINITRHIQVSSMKTLNTTNSSQPTAVEPTNLEEDAAFAACYKTFRETLISTAARYIADREVCKEIVQELFIHLYLRRKQLSITTSLSAYLFRSLRNRILNYRRKEFLYKKHLDRVTHLSVINTTSNEAEQGLQARFWEKILSECLVHLPTKYRDVYILAVLNDQSIRATAAILQRPIPTVDRQVRVAITLVRKSLTKYKILL